MYDYVDIDCINSYELRTLRTYNDGPKSPLIRKKNEVLAERGFDPRTSGLWAQHASTAPLCCCATNANGYLI